MEALGEALGDALGGQNAGVITGGCTIFLQGALGVGKTTLVRGFLRALGHAGMTKSPTYALVETYKLSGYDVHHFDLYRLSDPEELEHIGIRDYFSGDAIYIIEWPERGAGVLPPADLEINMLYDGAARRVFINAGSPAGDILVNSLK